LRDVPMAMSVPKYAAIDCASSGDNTIVAAVAAKKIVVTNYLMIAAAAVDATWYSASGGTALSGAMSLPANGGAAPGPVGHPCMETVAGEALVLNLGGAVQVSGHLTYVEVD